MDEDALTLLAELKLSKDRTADWAIKCLEAGFDSPSLRMLASMSAVTYAPSEIDHKLDLALKELAWDSISADIFLLHYARKLAREILDDQRDAMHGARSIFGILGRFDAPFEREPWYEIDDMIENCTIFKNTGKKDLYFREESEIVSEIKNACTDFLKRTLRNPSPLAEAVFEESESSFSRFLDSVGDPGQILWIFREDILIEGMDVYIRTPLPSENRALAKRYFEIGKARGLGVAFQAAYSLLGNSCCYVELPDDDLDAQYRLMGGQHLKLSSRKNMIEAEPISTTVRWFIKRLLTSNKRSYHWLKEIPARAEIIDPPT